jgi:hypothetical protein
MSRNINGIYRNYQKNEKSEESGTKILGLGIEILISGTKALGAEFYCLEGKGCLIFFQDDLKSNFL